MPIDRAATQRQAEKLLRQGKLEQAIAEYLRLVEDSPRDWNTANMLGDLYVRAGHVDRAIEQFSRIAESLRHEGFYPKSAALYKKVLKLRPDDDHALLQAGELAAQQTLLADARSFFALAASGRRHRGDNRGALEIVVRLGSLDPADVEARLAAAHAQHQLDDVTGALHGFADLAAMLVEQGRDNEALTPLREIATLDPGNAHAAQELARILIAQGRTSEAVAYLTPDAVNADPGFMLVAAEMRLLKGETESGLELIDALLAKEASAAGRVCNLMLALAESQPDTAFSLAERVVRARISDNDWAAAADVLTQFVSRVPGHLGALTQLVEVCVDGGLDDGLLEAQGLLVDAYLAAGSASEARYVAEDLVTRQPGERAHVARLRAAIAAGGDADPDRTLANWLAEASPFGIDAEPLALGSMHQETAEPGPPAGTTGSEADVQTGAMPAEPHAASVAEVPQAPADTAGDGLPQPVTPQTHAPSRNPHAINMDLIFGSAAMAVPPEDIVSPADALSPPDPVRAGVRSPRDDEEDLSVVLDEIRPHASSVKPGPAAPRQSPAASADIESVFAQMRDNAVLRSDDNSASDVAFTRGAAMFEAGELEPAIEHLRAATRSPHLRFAAASLLARLYQQQHRTTDAIEWLGHAVDAPEISAAERFDALLRLADLLESSGEPASALAVCLELQADAGDYRDVAARIVRLSRTQAGG